MRSHLDLAIDAVDPERLAAFWGTLLGREPVAVPDGVLLPGSSTQVGLRLCTGGTAKVGPNPMHLHLTSETAEAQDETVDRALALGASHLDVGQTPEEGHVVLADPEGNEFCVIEAGNSFLAGCGFLGEVACDGGREVGVFWSEALGWPLVWDQDDETAIQSPGGGTKIAWGGESEEPEPRGNRLRLRLSLDDGDLEQETARLVELGATVVSDGRAGEKVLTDPGGQELGLGR